MIELRKKKNSRETYHEKLNKTKEGRKEMLVSILPIREQLYKYGCIKGMTYFELKK